MYIILSLYSLGLFDDYALHGGHDGVALHFPDDASDHSQVGDQRRTLERFALHPVHGNVGQHRVADFIDRKSFRLDRTESTVGDRQRVDGRIERVRRQFFRVQVFQYHL